HALPLPTYKILPIKCMSAQKAGQDALAEVPNLYGYIEYLSYEGPDVYYPFGTGDFTIFPLDEVGAKRITDFYQQMGEWVALACTFSLIDLHLQNVRVRRYQPYLIDLEVSLGEPIADVDQTFLFESLHRVGGIDGFKVRHNKFVWQRV